MLKGGNKVIYKKFIPLLLLFVLGASIVGCSSNNPVISTATGLVYKEWKEPVKFESKIKKNYKTFKINLGIQTKSGTIKFEIRNPMGEIIWKDEVGAGQNYNEVKSFDAIDGTWYTYIISQNGEGTFNVKFSRNDN
jgi:hypothetical protein